MNEDVGDKKNGFNQNDFFFFFLDPTSLLDNKMFIRCEYLKCLFRGEFFG